MSRPWHTDQPVTAELARAVIAEQFPSLALRSVEPLGKGWDNTAFLIDDHIVFRFPRKPSAADLLVTEADVLPKLARRLPLPIPVPEWRGEPTNVFPWPFLGHRMIAGRTACSVQLSRPQRCAIARVIADFLAHLHAIPVSDLDLPGDVLDRANFIKRLPLIVERLDLLHSRGLIREAKPWLDLFAGLSKPEPTGAHTVVHGDLYACHLLIDSSYCLSGVIDWGDVHAGDPGIDLMILYSFLPAEARAEFVKIYGPVDASTQTTARLRAAFHAISVAWYGSELGDSGLAREGRKGMQLVLEE